MLLGKQSGVGKTVIISFAEDNVVENADAEDFRCFNQAVRAVAVFTGRRRISGRMVSHTERGEVIRIISARRASQSERKNYENKTY